MAGKHEKLAFRLRGVIEGFYGKPWTPGARLAMMDFLAGQQYNLYVYAPKHDPYHREKWREPYPESELAALAALAGRAAAGGVDFCFAVSPGLSLRYSDPGEVDRLLVKYRAMGDAGVRSFGLFFDDIPDELKNEDDVRAFGTLAAAQVHVANESYKRLVAEYGKVSFLICPTEYRGSGDSDYVRELGAGLTPPIEVFWTGRLVCSPAITAAEARELARVLRRPPLYWDNYPVNDGMMSSELHIGPYVGREAGLSRESAGIVLNPMNQPEASKIALRAAARFLRAPETYDAEAAWKEALAAVAGEEDEERREWLALFAAANNFSCLDRGQPRWLEEAVQGFRAKVEDGKALEGGVELAATLHKMLEAARYLAEELPDRALRREILPWVREFAAWQKVGEVAFAVMAQYWAMHSPDSGMSRGEAQRIFAERRAELKRVLQRTTGHRTKVCGDVPRSFAADVLIHTSHVHA